MANPNRMDNERSHTTQVKPCAIYQLKWTELTWFISYTHTLTQKISNVTNFRIDNIDAAMWVSTVIILLVHYTHMKWRYVAHILHRYAAPPTNHRVRWRRKCEKRNITRNVFVIFTSLSKLSSAQPPYFPNIMDGVATENNIYIKYM